MYGSSTYGSAAYGALVGGGYVLSATGLVFALALEQPAVGVLPASNIVYTPYLGQPVLLQAQYVEALDLVYDTFLSAPRLGSSYWYVNRGGDWLNPVVYAKHSGTWKLATGVWVNRDGTWHKIYEA